MIIIIVVSFRWLSGADGGGIRVHLPRRVIHHRQVQLPAPGTSNPNRQPTPELVLPFAWSSHQCRCTCPGGSRVCMAWRVTSVHGLAGHECAWPGGSRVCMAWRVTSVRSGTGQICQQKINAGAVATFLRQATSGLVKRVKQKWNCCWQYKKPRKTNEMMVQWAVDGMLPAVIVLHFVMATSVFRHVFRRVLGTMCVGHMLRHVLYVWACVSTWA